MLFIEWDERACEEIESEEDVVVKTYYFSSLTKPELGIRGPNFVGEWIQLAWHQGGSTKVIYFVAKIGSKWMFELKVYSELGTNQVFLEIVKAVGWSTGN